MPVVNVDLSPTSYRFRQQDPMSEGMMNLQASIARGITRSRELRERADREAILDQRYETAQQRLDRQEARQDEQDNIAIIESMNRQDEREALRAPKSKQMTREDAERLAMSRLKLTQQTDEYGMKKPFSSNDIDSEVARILAGEQPVTPGAPGPDARKRLDEFGRFDTMADPDATQKAVFDVLQPPKGAPPVEQPPAEDGEPIGERWNRSIPEAAMEAIGAAGGDAIEYIKSLFGGGEAPVTEDDPSTNHDESISALAANPDDQGINDLAAEFQRLSGDFPGPEFLDPLLSKDTATVEAALMALPDNIRADIAKFLLARSGGAVNAE